MTKRRVQLKWMSYQEDMRDLFCKLRETEELTDIIVSNGSKNIKCHRIILSSACKIFYDLMKEHSGDLVIYLGSVHTSDMTSLVDFMYSGVVNVRQDRLSEFLALAKQWGVRGLGMDGAGDKTQALVTGASSAAAPGGSGQGEPAAAAAKRRRPAASSDSSSEDEDSDAAAAARCPPAAGLSSAVLSVVNTDAAQKGKKGVTNIPSRSEHETTVAERQRVKKATTTPQRLTENIPDMFACPHCPRIFIKPHYFTTHKIKEHGDHTPISKHRVLMERGQANSTGAEVLSGGLKLRLPSKKKKKRSDEEEERSREDESGRVDREREDREKEREDREKEREAREKERKDREKEREAREKEKEEAARVNRERERKDREKERKDREKEREAREKEREEAERVNREREREERKRVEAARKAEQVRALAKKQAALAAAARAAAEESSSDSSDSEPASRPAGKSARRAPAASASAGPSSSDAALPQKQTGSGGSSAHEVHMKPKSVKEELPLPADTEERIVSYHSSDRDQARQSTTSSLSPHRRGPGGASDRPSARVAPSRLRYDSPTRTQKQSSSQVGQRIVFDENGDPRPRVGSGENSAEPDLDFLSQPPPGVHGSSRSRVQEDDPALLLDSNGWVDRGGSYHSGGRPGRGRGGRSRARGRGQGPHRGRGGDREAGRERTTPPQNRGGSNPHYIWVRDEYKKFGYSDHQGLGVGFWEQHPEWSGF